VEKLPLMVPLFSSRFWFWNAASAEIFKNRSAENNIPSEIKKENDLL